jgi:hypothetical protein
MLHNLYSSSNNINTTKLKRLQWEKHVVRMQEMLYCLEAFCLKTGRKEGDELRTGRRWEIKDILKIQV